MKARYGWFTLLPGSPILSHSFRFGVESIKKIVDWTLQYLPLSANTSILEVGSGNGTLLFALAEAGYTPTRLSGIDYSADAVKLAKSIALTRKSQEITFNMCDFLNEAPPLLSHMLQEIRQDVWDLLLDKGTFDAIALGEKDESGRSPATRYPEHVAKSLKPGGYFLITCAFIVFATGILKHGCLMPLQLQHVISLKTSCKPLSLQQKLA